VRSRAFFFADYSGIEHRGHLPDVEQRHQQLRQLHLDAGPVN
jgi:hypothetical protein